MILLSQSPSDAAQQLAAADCGLANIESYKHSSLLQSAAEGGTPHGQLVWSYEAVEEGTRPGTTAAIRIERGT